MPSGRQCRSEAKNGPCAASPLSLQHRQQEPVRRRRGSAPPAEARTALPSSEITMVLVWTWLGLRSPICWVRMSRGLAPGLVLLPGSPLLPEALRGVQPIEEERPGGL